MQESLSQLFEELSHLREDPGRNLGVAGYGGGGGEGGGVEGLRNNYPYPETLLHLFSLMWWSGLRAWLSVEAWVWGFGLQLWAFQGLSLEVSGLEVT